MVHYNIQSIANKLDLIETELRHYDVICLTKTWLDTKKLLMIFFFLRIINCIDVIELVTITVEFVFTFVIIFILVVAKI